MNDWRQLLKQVEDDVAGVERSLESPGELDDAMWTAEMKGAREVAERAIRTCAKINGHPEFAGVTQEVRGRAEAILETVSARCRERPADYVPPRQPFRDGQGRACDPVMYLWEALGMPITRVLKYGHKRATWGLVVDMGSDEREVLLGSTAELLQPRKVKAAILDVTGVEIEERQVDWRSFRRAMIEAAEVRDTFDPLDGLREDVTEFAEIQLTFERVDPSDGEQIAECIRNNGGWPPVLIDNEGRLWLELGPFSHWLSEFRERVSRQSLALSLRQTGFRPDRVDVREPGGRRRLRRRYFRSEEVHELAGGE